MYIVLGAIVLVVVVLAVWAWYRTKSREGNPPPEVTDEAPQAPEDRPRDWDPRKRYE